MNTCDMIIIGCGLTGAVIAQEAATKGKKVLVVERRTHIGGNMYDYVEEHGFLVQKYGPHAFHTTNKSLYEYICRFEHWQEYHLKCGATWDGRYTPTPFNFKTIDVFFDTGKAQTIKAALQKEYTDRAFVTVVEALEHNNKEIRNYAEYLFAQDYAPYTAKQWGISPDKIDPSVLKRVPLRLDYGEGYFEDEFQVLPQHSYTYFFQKLLDHPNIQVELGINALEKLEIGEDTLFWEGEAFSGTVVYTGALDELFNYKFGRLPYRSLRFEWEYRPEAKVQEAPIVAYPQESDYTRITEYKQLPPQEGEGTILAKEFPLSCQECNVEPYYPVLTEESQKCYASYRNLAASIPNLICCGRLGDFKYYNMDQALARALEIAQQL